MEKEIRNKMGILEEKDSTSSGFALGQQEWIICVRRVLDLKKLSHGIPISDFKADHPLFDWLINCVILNHF